MVFDANLVLRDGSVALTSASGETGPTALAADAYGAKVIDLNTTVRPRGDSEGAIHMVATLVLPTAPTGYGDTLGIEINESDNLTFGYRTIAYFGNFYVLTRMLEATVTVAFVAADLNAALTGQVSGDVGLLRWMHPDALTVGKTSNFIIAMAGAGDLYDSSGEEVRGGTAGRATMTGLSFIEAHPRLSGPNIHFRAFSTTKRYIQAYVTPSAVSTWGLASIFLSPYPFRKL